MILTRLEDAGRCAPLHPGFAAALEFLRTARPAEMAPGRRALDGERLYVVVDHKEGRGRRGARLEVHRKYIDIQFAVEGTDEIGWRSAAECRRSASGYDAAKDVELFADEPQTWSAVAPGSLAIFFPEDAHAPLGATGLLKKVIVKVAVDWPT